MNSCSCSVRVTLFDLDVDDVYRRLLKFMHRHGQCNVRARDARARQLTADYTVKGNGCTDEVHIVLSMDEYGSAVMEYSSYSRDTCALRSIFCLQACCCVGDCGSNQSHLLEMLEGLGVQDQDCIIELQQISGNVRWSGPKPPSSQSFIERWFPCISFINSSIIGKTDDTDLFVERYYKPE